MARNLGLSRHEREEHERDRRAFWFAFWFSAPLLSVSFILLYLGMRSN